MEAKQRLRRPWRNVIIIKLLGKRTGVKYMKSKLESLWAKSGPIVVADLGNDFFSVKFSSVEDLNLALTGGPWVLMGHYLAIRKWEPFFNPHKANIHRVAAWVRLPGIPQEFCVPAFLKLIGNRVGKVLKVDKITSTGDRGKFARLCVELDLSKSLRGEYILEEEIFKVEYEGLYLICLHCGKYGHNTENYPDSVRRPEENNNHAPNVAETAKASASQGVGPWMVVQKKNYSRNQVPRKTEENGERVFGADLSNKKNQIGQMKETRKDTGSPNLQSPKAKAPIGLKEINLKENKGGNSPLNNHLADTAKSHVGVNRTTGKSRVKSKATDKAKTFVFKAVTHVAENSSRIPELPSSKSPTNKTELGQDSTSSIDCLSCKNKEISPNEAVKDLCVKVSSNNIDDIAVIPSQCVLREFNNKPDDMEIANSTYAKPVSDVVPPDINDPDGMEMENIIVNDVAEHMIESDQVLCNPGTSLVIK
ncbi:uncharacterized protein LOC133306059 [Gastrolobium bilobum]|uniref:uncharacterized protein LOC133306059 n=1 Tax=Gastrolobium bilobum TaxID=150636 RepID=UPI002AB0C3E9|nr:uncharacterized protein LOC133306059 [Gastrolobium bilobum]